MLAFLSGRASDRKYQLFACACCRRLLGVFPYAVIRQFIEFGERDADRLANMEELFQVERAATAWHEARSIGSAASQDTSAAASAVRTAHSLIDRRPMRRETVARYVARDAAAAVRAAANDRRAVLLAPAGDEIRIARATWQAAEIAFAKELLAQAALLRDIVGNPFRPAILGTNCRPPEVVHFGRTIYDQRAFEWLPELADSLEEAGCTDAEVLAHCRQPGEHVLGCWGLDLVLGNE
jgi:hypothetical protein